MFNRSMLRPIEVAVQEARGQGPFFFSETMGFEVWRHLTPLRSSLRKAYGI